MFYYLLTTVAEIPEQARETQEFFVGAVCIVAVIVGALFLAYRKK